MASSPMSRVLTVRLPGPAARRLAERARALGVTPSKLVRALLEEGIGAPPGEPSALKLTARWVGCVRDARLAPGRTTRDALAAWKPDRRG